MIATTKVRKFPNTDNRSSRPNSKEWESALQILLAAAESGDKAARDYFVTLPKHRLPRALRDRTTKVLTST